MAAFFIESCHGGGAVDEDGLAQGIFGIAAQEGLHGGEDEEEEEKDLEEEEEVAFKALEGGVDALVVEHLAPEHEGGDLLLRAF